MRHYTAKELFENKYLDNFKTSDLVPIVCSECTKPFFRTLKVIKASAKNVQSRTEFYCSKDCHKIRYDRKITKPCANCGILTTRKNRDIKKSKTGNIFCSIPCGTKFNNLNKSHGTTRSKLEIFIEQKIKSELPNLECLFNSKKTIGSELDFYFPALKLAIELNGIFHYEPIHGQDKLERIQQNDQNKYAACRSIGIEMIIVPSVRSYYKPKDKELVWEGIKKIIDSKL